MKDSIEWYSEPSTDSIEMCRLRLVCKQFKSIIDEFFTPCEVCVDIRNVPSYPSLGLCIKDGTLKEYNKCKLCGVCFCHRCREEITESDPYLSEICPYCIG